MIENDSTPPHLYTQPTELLMHILTILPATQLIKCREVCSRWKDIIDSLSSPSVRSENIWHIYCKQDFNSIYLAARQKAGPGVTWYNIYRSLTLWPKLLTAREIRKEFAIASTFYEVIKSISILREGVIGVHKKGKIVYYDITTLELCQRNPIAGTYIKYIENTTTIVTLSLQLQLHVTCKLSCVERNYTYDDVKQFILHDNKIYFVTLTNRLFICRLSNCGLTQKYFGLCIPGNDRVMALGYTDTLNFLTWQHKIYSMNGGNIKLACSLETKANLLHELHKYNILDQLNWRLYFRWISAFIHTVPEDLLRNIVTVKSYEDVFFIGSNGGILRLYYAPYHDGVLDIFKSEPLKQFNFNDNNDYPDMPTCPILQVDVSEIKDGHTVFVVMPRKIAVLSFSHSFEGTASVGLYSFADIPYTKNSKTVIN